MCSYSFLLQRCQGKPTFPREVGALASTMVPWLVRNILSQSNSWTTCVVILTQGFPPWVWFGSEITQASTCNTLLTVLLYSRLQLRLLAPDRCNIHNLNLTCCEFSTFCKTINMQSGDLTYTGKKTLHMREYAGRSRCGTGAENSSFSY